MESVTKEDIISLPEVLKILEESKQNILLNKELAGTSRELQELSTQLREANELLRKKDRQKDEFLDTVTHELRTPITAIRASSEILHDDENIPEKLKKQFLSNIISESDRLNRLIDKILDLEKFESGKQKIYPAENDIIETISKAVKPLQQLMTNKNIAFKFNDSQSEVIAFYDEERIIQVITNLLSNAIKFCGETLGVISVSVSKNEDTLIVDVFNNGKNINPEDLDAIFEKFYQSSNQNIKKPIGSGLGLAICKQIIEVHKGKISAENETNGVRFSFTIPALKFEISEQ